jgi:predicted dehydrogenase
MNNSEKLDEISVATARVAITGIGGYGRILLDMLLEQQRFGLLSLDVAVVVFPEQDRDHLRYLKTQSPQTLIFDSLDHAIDAGLDLDLMVLPVGIGVHRELTIKSLRAGWNVLVEKPLAGSVEDAEAIIAAEQDAGCFVAVGFQDMYGEMITAMKEVLQAGTIGRLQELRVYGMWGRPASYFRRNDWAGRCICDGRAVYDSPFNNAMAHYVNMAFYLAGSGLESCAYPTGVTGEMWRAHDIESCDTARLRWTTDVGSDVAVFLSHTGADQIDPELRIRGEAGELRWKLNRQWTVCTADKMMRHNVTSLPELRRSMVNQVVARTKDCQSSVFRAAQALAHVEAVELAHSCIKVEDFSADRVERVFVDEVGGERQEFRVVCGLNEEGSGFLNGCGI